MHIDSNAASPSLNTAKPLKKGEKFVVNGVPFNMNLVASGTFMMGDDFVENQSPEHIENISDFYMGETEVTQALWEAVMGNNPSDFRGHNLPVEQVNWEDCQRFILKLNQMTGKYFRLPTEAEWEYAHMGGNNGVTYNREENQRWFLENSGNHTHDVATQSPNSELGLYDMIGNVWEWCDDHGSANYYSPRNCLSPERVIRGNCFCDSFDVIPYKGERQSQFQTNIYNTVGMRLAMTARPKTIIPSGVYFICSAGNPDLVLDNVPPSNNVRIWHKRVEDNKLWRVVNRGDGSIVILSMQNSDYVVDCGAGIGEHNNIYTYPYNGTEAQIWYPEKIAGDTYILKNPRDLNYALSVDNDRYVPDSNVAIRRVDRYSNINSWIFVPVK